MEQCWYSMHIRTNGIRYYPYVLYQRRNPKIESYWNRQMQKNTCYALVGYLQNGMNPMHKFRYSRFSIMQ